MSVFRCNGDEAVDAGGDVEHNRKQDCNFTTSRILYSQNTETHSQAKPHLSDPSRLLQQDFLVMARWLAEHCSWPGPRGKARTNKAKEHDDAAWIMCRATCHFVSSGQVACSHHRRTCYADRQVSVNAGSQWADWLSKSTDV